MKPNLSDDFFESLLAVDTKWTSEYIGEYHSKAEKKLNAKVFAVKFSGQKYLTTSWVKHITRRLKHFLYDKKKIELMTARGEEPYQEAMQAFGDVDPITDGKYGELILFLLVESVLRAPMMVHKISHLQNRHDQAKGADNLFIGTYKGERTIFLGESKIKTNYDKALHEALDSINRFYLPEDSASIDQEFIISRNNIRTDLSKEQLEYLYEILDQTSHLHQNTNKAHPIFIMYDFDKIENIEIECTNAADGDTKLQKHVIEWLDKKFIKIQEKLKEFTELQSTDLIFFLIPVKDSKAFRDLMYTTIHGTSYRKKL